MKQILYFCAKWCGPCKALGPLMQEFSKTYPVQKVDIEEQQEIATKFGIKAVPTVMIVEGDKILASRVGASSKVFYQEMFKQYDLV